MTTLAVLISSVLASTEGNDLDMGPNEVVAPMETVDHEVDDTLRRMPIFVDPIGRRRPDASTQTDERRRKHGDKKLARGLGNLVAGVGGFALGAALADNGDNPEYYYPSDYPEYYYPSDYPEYYYPNAPRPYYPSNNYAYPAPRPYYPSNDVGSNNGGCQSAADCNGGFCYLGSNGQNFCSNGNGQGSLCDDNSSCPWGTSCQYGVCVNGGGGLIGGRRLAEELQAPAMGADQPEL
jgi:hypothetical protein